MRTTTARGLRTGAMLVAALCSSRPSLADEPPPADPAPNAEPAPPDAPPVAPSDAPPADHWKPPPAKPPPPGDHWSSGQKSEPRSPDTKLDANKPPPTPPTPDKPTRWYGWQTLLVDAATTSLMIGAVADSREPGDGVWSLLAPTRLLEKPPEHTAFIDGSLALWTLAPAFVHAVHGRGKQAALSAPIRLCGPTLGTLTGAVYGFVFAVIVALADSGNGFDNDSSAVTVLAVGVGTGYLLGFVAPILIDSIIFAREPIEPEEAAADKRARAKPPSLHWTPRLGMSKDGPTFGVGGTF